MTDRELVERARVMQSTDGGETWANYMTREDRDRLLALAARGAEVAGATEEGAKQTERGTLIMDASPVQIAAMSKWFDRAEMIDDAGHGAPFVVVAQIKLQRDTRNGSRAAYIEARWVGADKARAVSAALVAEAEKAP